MRGRTLIGVGLLLALGLVMQPGRSQEAKPARAGEPKADGLDADEVKIDRLIREMGHDEYKVREAATKELQSMGPAIVPVIQKYINHKDPEIAIRVGEIIEAYKWMRKGALFIKVKPNREAARLGFQVGDVLVRINDRDITGYEDDVEPDPGKEVQTYHLWRSGRIIVKKARDINGYTLVNWDFEKGGNDHARGVAALAVKKWDEAYRRLLAAYRAGMDDHWTLDSLWGLAEYYLDHKLAMEVHAFRVKCTDWYRGGSFDGDWSHLDIDGDRQGLPMTSAHAAHLLRRMKEEPFSSELYYRLATYFAGYGRNLALLRQATAKQWTDTHSIDYDAAGRYTWARFELAFFERRYRDVLAEYEGILHTPGTARLAVQAAIMMDDAQRAGEIALDILERGARSTAWEEDTANAAYYSLAACVADGRDELATRVLDGLLRYAQKDWEKVGDADGSYACHHMAVLPKLAPALWKVREGAVGHDWSNYMILRLSASLPALTLEKWEGLFADHNKGKETSRRRQLLNVMAYLRFGRWAEAREAMKLAEQGHGAMPGFRRAADFLEANAERFGKDWKSLRGVVQVFPAKEEGMCWAARYDGHVFHVDVAGKIREFPGLPPGVPHLPVGRDQIKTFPTGTVYFRRRQVYLFDEQAERWIPTYTSPCKKWIRVWEWKQPALPELLRYIMREFPLEDRQVVHRVQERAGWHWYILRGDVALAVNGKTGKIVNVSKEIARAAGRDKPVAVYRIGGWTQKKTLVPTEIGLWIMDDVGKVRQFKLPLKDQNVMVSLMTWPTRKGAKYVGVAPQQGGHVIKIDGKTGTATLTGGYYGKGPDDSFAQTNVRTNTVYCEWAIQKLYEKRLAREKAKAEAGE